MKIWELPEEMTLMLFRGLHVRDVLNLRSANSYFRDLIDSNPSLWSHVSFSCAWPSVINLRHFEKASQNGNFEALVKLGIAYLYNEGLPGDISGREITGNGERAAELFCQLELTRPHLDAFTWIFIRPPWASCGACCKEFVFTIMKQHANLSGGEGIHVCIAKTLQLLEEEDWESDITYHLTQAVHNHSSQGALMLWQKHCKYSMNSWAGELSALRELRHLVFRSKGTVCHIEASLELCHLYAQGRYGGVSPAKAWSFLTDFLQSSKPLHIEKAFRPDLTPSMRYILIDWLVEVAGMKDFSSLTLHTAISIVDRYLRLKPTTRSQLQLLGVAAMVISSRFLGRDIITVREAAWLTDNTYKYGDVVKMLGEITAVLQGNFRTMMSLDYVTLLGQLLSNDSKTQSLAEYMCELSLLHASLGELPQAQLAAATCLVARMHTHRECIWPSHMYQASGFSLENITSAALEVHKKCFVDFSLRDYRQVELQAVKQRYDDERFHAVSSVEILSRSEVLNLLGVKEKECAKPMFAKASLLLPPSEAHDLILSPSRHGRKSATCMCEMSAERENAATPTLEAMEASFDLNDSTMSEVSGYEGDMEDEEESFFNWNDNTEEEPALESLWCEDISILDGWNINVESGEASSSWNTTTNSGRSISSPIGLSSFPSLRVTLPSSASASAATAEGTSEESTSSTEWNHAFNKNTNNNNTTDLDITSHTPETGNTLKGFHEFASNTNLHESFLPISNDGSFSCEEASLSQDLSQEGTSLQSLPTGDLSALQTLSDNVLKKPAQVKRKSSEQDGNLSKKYVFSVS